MPKRSRPTAAPKQEKAMVITAEQQRKMRDAARRQDRLAAPKQTGSGYHGGGIRADNRRDRQKNRANIRRGSFD